MKKLVSLVGARPQFVKEALVGKAARAAGLWQHVLVHSGQHYDVNMSDVFFQELGIPAPDHHLGIGSGPHGAMTAAALTAMENVLLQEKPTALLVYGDTNTTLAGALAAAKLHIPVVHVEAGIRQEPRTMPEEINRVLTDHIARVFCCCSQLAAENLHRENIRENVYVTGDVMYDQFLHLVPRFAPAEACKKYAVEQGRFIVATLHRDFNVDTKESLTGLLEGLQSVVAEHAMPVLFFIHPRTQKQAVEFGLEALLQKLTLLPPVGYMDLMSLTLASALVITDSGGLQKEAYYAGKRAVVVMPDTGWRELTACGWNLLANPHAADITEKTRLALQPAPMPQAMYGNGNAAQAIIDAVRPLFV